jgi:UDP-N-acetylmuramoyl-L-alanyl-D-glutamate--2,6-diaminopimelate ligase
MNDFQSYSGIYYDSRKVQEGSIFVCIRGEKSDGHDFIESAISAGAKFIIIEDKSLTLDKIQTLKNKHTKVKFESVKDTRLALAEMAAQFYNDPSKRLTVIGVTGTNGKTTVTHLIQKILESDQCALLGTIGLKENPDAPYRDIGNTTPQSADIQEILDDFAKRSYKYITMEVSSHALEQQRVAAIHYKTAVVTNLTQDHLDYHITMDKYCEAKSKLFALTEGFAILNADDEYFPKFLTKAEEQKLSIISYGIDTSADLMATDLEFNDQGLSFKLLLSKSFLGKYSALNLPKGSFDGMRFSLRLNGLFNVYNSLAAIVVGLTESKSLEQIRESLAAASPVSGRFEVIKEAESPFCIVDYAHTPDGLQNILKGASELLRKKPSKAKLICLFGCGGDRDITKRPKMGKIAYDLADLVYVTSDNPRTEDPEQIIADILAGIPDMAKVRVITDRASAIRESVRQASSEDILVIAGKGHEDYQILGTTKIHFDDREQVRAAILRTYPKSPRC